MLGPRAQLGLTNDELPQAACLRKSWKVGPSQGGLGCDGYGHERRVGMFQDVAGRADIELDIVVPVIAPPRIPRRGVIDISPHEEQLGLPENTGILLVQQREVSILP